MEKIVLGSLLVVVLLIGVWSFTCLASATIAVGGVTNLVTCWVTAVGSAPLLYVY